MKHIRSRTTDGNSVAGIEHLGNGSVRTESGQTETSLCTPRMHASQQRCQWERLVLVNFSLFGSLAAHSFQLGRRLQLTVSRPCQCRGRRRPGEPAFPSCPGRNLSQRCCPGVRLQGAVWTKQGPSWSGMPLQKGASAGDLCPVCLRAMLTGAGGRATCRHVYSTILFFFLNILIHIIPCTKSGSINPKPIQNSSFEGREDRVGLSHKY